MFNCKVLVLVSGFLSFHVSAETTKRDLVRQQSGLEFLQLGNFGPISRISSHPSFSHLGLTPQQTVEFVNILLQNGLLNSNSLRYSNGQPFWNHPVFSAQNGNFFAPLVPIDPYVLFLMSNYARFLPFGLGSQGFYGSTGLPRPKPLVYDFKDFEQEHSFRFSPLVEAKSWKTDEQALFGNCTGNRFVYVCVQKRQTKDWTNTKNRFCRRRSDFDKETSSDYHHHYYFMSACQRR